MPKPLTAQDLAEAPDEPTPEVLARTGRIRPVLLYPDPMLRQICAPAGQMDWQSMVQLAADLLVSMYDAGGRGLAAPQIGEPYRMFVMDHGWKQGSRQPRVILDPWITALDGPDTEHQESCLSLPDQPVLIRRPDRVAMAHFDLLGNATTSVLTGIEARIAQHETDHLDGRLIIDQLQADDPASGQIVVLQAG